jgi:hypothetical protein
MFELGRKAVVVSFEARDRFRGNGRRNAEAATDINARDRFRGNGRRDPDVIDTLEARDRFRGNGRRDPDVAAPVEVDVEILRLPQPSKHATGSVVMVAEIRNLDLSRAWKSATDFEEIREDFKDIKSRGTSDLIQSLFLLLCFTPFFRSATTGLWHSY